MHIIDRRLNPGGKSFANRQRFLRRARAQVRRAVREDAGLVRDWGQERAARLRGSVEAEPVKATLYALGLGVVIGLLISR